MARLTGKTALITGGSEGIGLAIATAFAREGANLVLLARDRRKLDALTLPNTRSVAVDLNDEDALVAAVGSLDVDVLVNNAGLGGTAPIQDMTDQQWSRVLDVTLNGTFRCTRAAVRLFREQGGGGVVVNNASVVGWRAQAGQAHYAAAKAGVMALTRCAAVDAAEFGVRVNAVAPSLVLHDNLAKVTSPQLLSELESAEAFGRSAQPWEVATVVVFLASDHASYLTGEVISASSQHP